MKKLYLLLGIMLLLVCGCGKYSEKDVVKEVVRKIRNRYDVDAIHKKGLKQGIGKVQSFLDPVVNEESRTTKSVPRRGFTSISGIAKG